MYPKTVWVLTRAQVVVENDKEVVDHNTDVVVGATFDSYVAEKLAAMLKQHESTQTIIMSDVNPLPLKVLEALDQPQNRTLLDEILENHSNKE